NPFVQELHFPHIHHIPIVIDRVLPVTPACPIPVGLGDTLYLSNLDDMIGARVFTPTVFFYPKHQLGLDPRPIMRKALAAVLVPYYPFSGRLRETKNGKLQVFFGHDQGALMVEAHSNMSLSDLGDLTVPNPAWGPLVYKFADEGPYKVTDMPLVIAQVTLFQCGGFCLGLRTCHCISDGLGAMQFLNAWASTARAGKLVIHPIPCWDREKFKPDGLPKVRYPHTEFMNIEEGSNLTMNLWQTKPVQKCYRVSREFQAHIKQLGQESEKIAISTFDAMAAHVWRCWVKALEVEPAEFELRLTFSVNARQKMKQRPLGDGFYGNALCIACATSTISELSDGLLSDIASRVHESRQLITEEYVQSTIDYIELKRPTRLEFGGKLTITQWTRFSMYESTNFGWGRAIYAGPIDLTPTPQICVFLPEGEPGSTGNMLLFICLPQWATLRFARLLSLLE
ncbi:omega-hydroxypalmitate O-feruloyl transferase, partial [Impatiens glandulifera]|uniref:omega-hydroxypalmitate O-feruloyl transferase n=1 Tax=Impatiens glandulifera TaxID=253017 RepID=UPI001FB17374